MLVVSLVLIIYGSPEVVQVIPRRAVKIKFRWHGRQMVTQLEVLLLNFTPLHADRRVD